MENNRGCQAFTQGPPKLTKNELRKGHDKFKEFLRTYKVEPCPQKNQHNYQLCYFYHCAEDRRRNPYFQHSFLYYPDIDCHCDLPVDLFSTQNCKNCHSIFERVYHPRLYKIEKCAQYHDCPLSIYCPKIHFEDQQILDYSQFFRLDIVTFKSKPCPKKEPHQRKTCLYYHDRDKRRPTTIEYNHFVCKEKCKDLHCGYSHNKIEQLYHPSRYKSKFCQHYPKNIQDCEYGQFCSFAHSLEEITIQLIHLKEMDYNFYINQYKTVWCPHTNSHQRAKCVYAHNFQDFRRKPTEYKYIGKKCEYWNFEGRVETLEQGGCKAGMNCDKCHGWKQIDYHPQNYKKNKKEQNDKRVEKKLNGSKQGRKDKSKDAYPNKIQQIFNQDAPRKGLYSIGAPFFKQDKDISQTSKKTKARTHNFNGSDMSHDDSSNTEDVSYNNKSNQSSVKVHHILNFDLINNQDSALWGPSKSPQCKSSSKSKSRAKSEKKSSDDISINYSQSIVEIFKDDAEILDRLKKQKISQQNLKKMITDKNKIQKLSYFNSEQKKQIQKKLINYSLRQDLKTINYSKDLTRFLVEKNYSKVLQNFKMRKIREEKLLKITSKELKDYSFLSDKQREEFPKMLKQYMNQRQFTDLNNEIYQNTLK